MFIVQALGVQLADPVAGLLVARTATVELGIAQGSPVAQAALACQRKQATGIAAIADQVELVAQQQPAALVGQGVVARCVAGQLGGMGKQGKLRVDQAVVDSAQAIRAVALAIAQGAAGSQALLPAAAQGFWLAAVEMVGELQQLDALVAAEHHHGIAQVAAIQVHPHRQRHVEKVFFKLPWQPLGLADHAHCIVRGLGSDREHGKACGQQQSLCS
ncbi:hypothetical protein D3C75_864340 [compost metagenome]